MPSRRSVPTLVFTRFPVPLMMPLKKKSPVFARTVSVLARRLMSPFTSSDAVGPVGERQGMATHEIMAAWKCDGVEAAVGAELVVHERASPRRLQPQPRLQLN